MLQYIGMVYHAQTRHDAALGRYEEALDINRYLGLDPDVAMILNLIGRIYYDQGRYDQALARHEKALGIWRQFDGSTVFLAATLHSIGSVYRSQGRYDKALAYYEEALVIYRRLGHDADVANVLYSIGWVQKEDHYDEAITHLEESLAIHRRLGHDADVAMILNLIGRLLLEKGYYSEEVFAYFEEALSISQRLGDNGYVAAILNSISNYHILQGRNDEAATALEKAVSIHEQMRRQLEGETRRDYLAAVIGSYRSLVPLLVRIGESNRAFVFAERSQARLLADNVAARDSTTFAIPPVSSLQKAVGDQAALLTYSSVGPGFNVTAFVLTQERLIAETLDRGFIAEVFATYGGRLSTVRRHIRERRSQQRIAFGFPGKADRQLRRMESIVHFYRQLLVQNRQHETSMRASSGAANTITQVDLAQRFYSLLIAPIEKHLGDKTDLIIIPAGPIAFLPFETLIDEENRYLAERFHVRYAPSATVLHNLQKRDFDTTDRRALLAFGGALYDGTASSGRTFAQDTARYVNTAQIEAAQRRAYADLSRGGDLEGTYDALGHGTWADLPGTLAEVAALAETVPGADVVTGPAVSEAEIKRRSENGDLSMYRLLHFATHALVVPEVPELSALVLSQDSVSNAATGEDGYLRMAEIAQLDLSADVVTLSACETGLGQLVSGEGVVGLTQAFIEAGAGGVSASLWQVSDRSTSAFMQEVYRKVQDEGRSFAEAHTEVKRGFIRGDYLDAWRAPYYWAPYVYYGP
jgi:CHAT domain-containing protein/tetratricopeptide (TPR) repeat protein